MRIVTTPNIPGEQAHALVGLVHETAVVSADAVHDMFASFKNFVGGKVGNYEKVAKAARDRAIEAAIESARAQGANAIVGFQIDIEFSPQDKGGYFSATAIGTAVVSQPAGTQTPLPL